MQQGEENYLVGMGVSLTGNKFCLLRSAHEDDQILRSWKLNPISSFCPSSKMGRHFFMTAGVVVSLTYCMGLFQGREEDECSS